MKPKSNLINYVQYLRAFALFIAFFYHLEINFFKNGYLGLDIFFVISGFVITKMLLDSYYLNSKIDLYKFYKKRFKRIYPVLFFFLIVVLFVLVILSPLDLYLDRLTVIIYAFFGLSNFYYIFKDQDYFDTIFIDPLNHTWSLGVEEQFYLVFPFFFSSLLILFRGNIKKIGFAFILLIFIGVFFTYIYQENSKLIFYSPLFRFWEFLLGGFILLGTYLIKKKSIFYSTISFILLIIVIFSGNFFTNFQKIFLVSFLVSILLFFCDDKFLIKNKPVHNFIIYIADISYSFYLWHLLVIYFYKLYIGIDVFGIIFIFIITLILSSTSFRFVEQKFRYSQINFNMNFKKIISSFLIFVSIVFFINFIVFQDGYNNKIKKNLKNLVYKFNYLENKLNFTERTVFYKVNINGNEIYRFCTESSQTFKLDSDNLRLRCLKKGEDKNRIFYVEGNSHTANFIPMLNSIRIKDSIYFNHKAYPLEKINFEHINGLLKSFEEVVYTTNINNLDSLEKLISKKNNFSSRIKILIMGTPPYVNENIDPLECLIKNINCKYDTILDKKNRNIILLNSKIEQLSKNDQKIFYFNPYKSICPNNTCYVFDKEKNLLTHRDDSHLTIEGSLLMENEFTEFYRSKFMKN